MIDIARLRELEAKATAGPWFRWTTSGDIASKPEDGMFLQHALCNCEEFSEAERARANADCDFIIEMRNALLELLDEVERYRNPAETVP